MPDPLQAQSGGSQWIPIIGSVGSSLINSWTQNQTNTANADQAREQMQFQERMSGTAYQRSVEDMRKAGLNPALAYGQGGASTPTGSAAQLENPRPGDALSAALETYNNFATGSAQRELLRNQSAAAAAAAEYTRTQALALKPDAVLGESGDYLSEYARNKFGEIRQKVKERQNYDESFRANMRLIDAQSGNALEAAALARSQQTLNEQQFTNEWFRKKVQPYVNSGAASLKVFQDLLRGVR